MKKLLYILFGFLFICNAYAAQIVNVEYIHNLISQEWDITVPYNPALTNVKTIANMKYLLTAVDVANEILNGEKTSNYGNTEFATTRIADTIATIQAVETLVRKIDKGPEFTLTTTPDTTSFSFKIGAAGEFVVDWGDGTIETITKANTTTKTYSHNYATAGTYTIGISGQATAHITSTLLSSTTISFSSSASKIALIDGSLGAIFGTLTDGSQPRFSSTFSGCSGLTSIPENLFAGISGAPAGNMFASTFSKCSGLTSIPAGLFAGISGKPASSMFSNTFSGCSGLTSIPSDLFAGISGKPATNMFSSTFSGCSGLTSIPENLFAGISGAPAYRMFYETFSDCSGLTSIPSDLFAGISDAPASEMFSGTFSGCSDLTGAIPDGLFGNLTGAPASGMFNSTFSGCSGLTGAIPDGLFGNLTGAPASNMFFMTFSGCSGLTGAIPDGLFGNITGAPASNMFYSTFSGCSGLTSIPENLFGNISGTAQSYMFRQTFKNCTSLTGPSARINGQYLYEIWPSATSDQVGDMYSGATGLDDYRCIPAAWGGGGEDCSAPTAEFTLTTTPDTSSFEFSISAAGEFVVDWGDGTVETITKPDTTDTTYSHNYATAGAYTIGLSGQATAYNTDEYTAAISFSSSAEKIASIDGSLGAIFGTLSSDTNNQPRFYQTFYGATNMTGSIPSDLFAGISGAPARGMFEGTFYRCIGLTGAIPDGLFAGISGAPASYMFHETFRNCSKLTSIPENLFGNISGTAQYQMFDGMFMGCTSLTGPSARINGQYLYEIWPTYPGWLFGAYIGCTGLSDYSTMPTMWKTDD